MQKLIAGILIMFALANLAMADIHLQVDSEQSDCTSWFSNQGEQDRSDQSNLDPDHCSHASAHFLGLLMNYLPLEFASGFQRAEFASSLHSYLISPPTFPPRS